MINDTGEALRVEVTYSDSGPYEVSLARGACLWEGKSKGQEIKTKHITVTAASGLRQEIDVAALLAKTVDPKNAAIIIGKSSLEVTTIKEARSRRLLP